MNTALALASLTLGAIGCVLAIWSEVRLRRTRTDLFYAERSEASWLGNAIRAEAQLATIRRQRSETTRNANATRKARILSAAAQIDRETGRAG